MGQAIFRKGKILKMNGWKMCEATKNGTTKESNNMPKVLDLSSVSTLDLCEIFFSIFVVN